MWAISTIWHRLISVLLRHFWWKLAHSSAYPFLTSAWQSQDTAAQYLSYWFRACPKVVRQRSLICFRFATGFLFPFRNVGVASHRRDEPSATTQWEYLYSTFSYKVCYFYYHLFFPSRLVVLISYSKLCPSSWFWVRTVCLCSLSCSWDKRLHLGCLVSHLCCLLWWSRAG